jgi:hypothetical protein
MVGMRLHLSLDAMSVVSDIYSTRVRPRGFLQKHLPMLLLDINKEQVCLMYQSTEVYNYKWISDWSILIAKLLSPLVIRDRGSVEDDVDCKEIRGTSWMKYQKRKEKEFSQKGSI